ncbi:hypothetical protein MUP79_08710 [Candidatus Bathyarchaeota archaeon]|nr:hypothetical protein [Candidatus Bathyarchaeota archaeon]
MMTWAKRQREYVDYYWNNPKARPFEHPSIPKERRVKVLIDWAEYQHLEHILAQTNPEDQYYRGSQIIRDGERFIMLSSDEHRFNAFLPSELIHLAQTEREAMELDATGVHGELSQRVAEEKLANPRWLRAPPSKLGYVDLVLTTEFAYTTKDLKFMTTTEKTQRCREEIQARYARLGLER